MKIPKLTRYQQKKIANNLEELYKSANKKDKKSGLNWYQNAHKICLKLQEDNKNLFSLNQVASVLSALSPRNKWERNILDASNVLRAVRLKKQPQQIKVCTFNKNKIKAFNIAKGIEKIKETSKKTFSFVNNIALLDDNFVTVDLWHLRACFGATIKTGLTPKNYEIIKDITIKQANKVGLTGYEFQAVVWEVLRNKNIY